MDYKAYFSHRDHYLAIACIRKAHGLRHYYAQPRYIILSNGLTPPKLNIGEKPKLTAAERELDLSARLTVSKELGHTRLDITHIHLG